MPDPRSYDPSSHFVTKSAPGETSAQSPVESAPLNTHTVPAQTLSESKALPALEWILSAKSRAVLDRARELQDDEPDAIRERILSRMALQSAKEENAHFYDDRQVALITVIKAARGDAGPYADAVRSVLHCHPEEVFARVTQNRKAKLGKEYRLWYDAAGNLRPDAPKKSSTSIRKPIPQTKKQPMAESREGDAPQKTCAYGAQESKLTGQKRRDLTGASCSTETKREARRALTSEFGLNDDPPAGVAAPADKKPRTRKRSVA